MLYMDIDRAKVRSLGLTLDDVNQALQVFLGSQYVNNFNVFGRYWQVNVQAEGDFRNRVPNVSQIKLRNSKGEMVPLSTLARMSDVGGPIMVTRYNLYASAPVNGIIIPPLSSGQGIKVVDDLVDTVLPRSMGAEWTDLTYMQIKAGNTAMYVFGLAVVFVFLALAALYESWTLPLAVILVVPMCLLSSLIGVLLRRLAMDIFVQIGFVVLVGLACKNAILIVEFAKQLRGEGKPRFEATKEACRLRLRPILMTSFAFILGVLPMVIAQGAGAEMRWSLGTAVFSGMLGVTLFGIFLTPVFFYVIEGLGETKLFRLPEVQWLGSALIGAAAGLVLGFLGWKVGIPQLRWALAGGLALGVVTAILVQGGHRRIKQMRQPESMIRPACDLAGHTSSEGKARPRRHCVISHFFIDRPIFASVLSIVLTIAGTVALFTLPIAQYPDVAPPTVLVTASYPGANAQTVRDTVAAPIEQQVSGVENMIYMSSQCTNDGTYILTVTFKLGMDSDMAQVLVQNRVSLAEPVIPNLVQRQGINVRKQSPSTMMIVNLVSAKDSTTHKSFYDDIYLSNYATIQIKDELGRLPGVAAVSYMGERDYSMRAWLDPNKMATLGLSTDEVVRAISEQNLQVAAGQIGQEPVAKGQAFQLTINTLGRLIEVDQFGAIIIKVGQGGKNGLASSIVRLGDVARLELGSQQYDQSCTLDGKPSVALSIYQLPGSNAIKTAQGVYEKMKELKKRFPQGLNYRIVYDTTPFIRESIIEVFRTLRDAVILVAIVVLIFLQNWRATLIPLIAVPVAIIGTFAVMAAIGFSLNNLSLFGLVLAIGIVVDDAIVVVENVERWLEQGLPPREAARKAMDEVTGPVVAVAVVLCAVFVPCAFITGITGQFFRQFAITIAVSTVFSALNSLTLSPALAAILLKPHDAKKDPLTRLLDFLLGWFFKLFNAGFTLGTNGYTRMVGRAAAGQPDRRLAGVRRAALPDVLELYASSHRIHSRTRQGLLAHERAASRLGFGAAHARGCRSPGKDGPRHGRRRAHGGDFRTVTGAERQRPEPGLDVRHAQGVSRPRPGIEQPTALPPRCGPAVARRSAGRS